MADMVRLRLRVRLRPRVISGLLVILIWSLAPGRASAGIRTWTGNGGTNLWQTVGNWQGNVLPQAGDALVFPAGAVTTDTFNNFPAGTTFLQVTFLANYSIGGNAMGVTNMIDTAANVTADIYMPITLANSSDTQVVLVPGPGSTLTFHHVIAGGTGLMLTGGGTVVLAGGSPNTYTGVTTLNFGTLLLHQSGVAVPGGLIVGDGIGGPNSDLVQLGAFDQIAGDVSVAPSGLLDLNGFADTIGALSIMSGTVQTGSGSLTLGGDLTVPDGSISASITGHLVLGAITRTFTIGTGGTGGLIALDINAQISASAGGVGITKTGPGWLRLSGANSYPGDVTIQNGIVSAATPTAFGTSPTGAIVTQSGTAYVEATVSGMPMQLHTTNAQSALSCGGNGNNGWLGPITVTAPNQLSSNVGCTLQTGSITGTGDIVIGNSGPAVEFLQPNDYSGKTTVLSGTLRLKAQGAIPTTSDVTLLNGSTLDMASGNQAMASLQGTGSVLISNKNLVIVSKPDTSATFSGSIIGSGAVVTNNGPGDWILTGNSPFTGSLGINNGSVIVEGSIAAATTVLTGGALYGTGSVSTITGVSGRVQPGHKSTPGLLTSNSLILKPTMTFGAIVNGASAGSQYSQLKLTGSVTLAGAALDITVDSNFLSTGAGPGPLVIIDNDGTDPVSGTFNNLAEGALVTSNGVSFRISYVGGTGNDVTLTPVATQYYLSEGATGSFFDTDVLIANPNPAAVSVMMRFLKDDGTTIAQDLTLAATSRTTIRVDDVAGMEATAFSTIVTSPSGAPLVVERTMRWDSTGYGGHTEKAVTGPALTWYFAEGSQGFFSTFLLLANPQTFATTATVHYLIEGATPVTRTYPLLPQSRFTVDMSADSALQNWSFGIVVDFSAPGVAERAMYFGTSPLWTGGHESAGETQPSTTWYVAEGATGSYFTTFILLANPTATDAQADVTFLPETGVPVTKVKTVPAFGRVTINIAAEDPTLTNVAASTVVTSTGAPILVVRSQYWPYTPDQWQEAHNSFGVTAPGTKWGLAEGRVGGPEEYQTYILLANPGAQAVHVDITFLREDGTTLAKSFVVAPTSRLNVPVGPGTAVPELSNERFGAVLTADQPIAVERAMYWNANGIVWAAGTSATATKLP